ncbi:hypothetical protein J3L11_04245 [Shewanella sp. 4t3-1-2LB]|nr:hypothetical protein [Shewanella sp. 4t3-1-2LB]
MTLSNWITVSAVTEMKK